MDPSAHEVTVLHSDGGSPHEERLGSGRHHLTRPFPVLLGVDALFS